MAQRHLVSFADNAEEEAKQDDRGKSGAQGTLIFARVSKKP